MAHGRPRRVLDLLLGRCNTAAADRRPRGTNLPSTSLTKRNVTVGSPQSGPRLFLSAPVRTVPHVAVAQGERHERALRPVRGFLTVRLDLGLDEARRHRLGNRPSYGVVIAALSTRMLHSAGRRSGASSRPQRPSRQLGPLLLLAGVGARASAQPRLLERDDGRSRPGQRDFVCARWGHGAGWCCRTGCKNMLEHSVKVPGETVRVPRSNSPLIVVLLLLVLIFVTRHPGFWNFVDN